MRLVKFSTFHFVHTVLLSLSPTSNTFKISLKLIFSMKMTEPSTAIKIHTHIRTMLNVARTHFNIFRPSFSKSFFLFSTTNQRMEPRWGGGGKYQTFGNYQTFNIHPNTLGTDSFTHIENFVGRRFCWMLSPYNVECIGKMASLWTN